MTTWRKVEGPGPESLPLNAQGGFEGLHLEPGRDLELRCAIQCPASVAGAALVGEPLEATIYTLYPVEFHHEGALRWRAEGVPVAAGPALIELIPSLREGGNGELRLRICVPDQEVTPWLSMELTTPTLRDRFERLDRAWAWLYLAQKLGRVQADGERGQDVLKNLDAVLDSAESDGLEGALEALAASLDPIIAGLSAPPVHLIGHSHIDLNWQWTWPDTVATILRDLRSVLSLMDEFPELTFSHSQPATYEVLREREPAQFEKVREHIRSGRWEPLTLQWVEGDTNLAAGESQVRQALHAVRYTREMLGSDAQTFHAPDTFGHAGNIPQLITSAGARHYYHHRCNPGGYTQWPAYWWEGVDGSRVLALSTPSYNGEITAGDLARASVAACEAGLPVAMHFHGLGDHGGGPARHNLQALRRLREDPLLPRARCSTISAYAGELLSAGPKLPLHRGESALIFEGCYTTHADAKRYNRWGENLLITAETLCALAGIDRREVLHGAWRKLLFNQFHDILCGAGIHAVYEDCARDFEAVEQAATEAVDAALDRLHAGTPADHIVVTNPLGSSQRHWVELSTPLTSDGPLAAVDATGRRTPAQRTDAGVGFVADLGPLQTRVYQLEPEESAPPQLSVCEAYSPGDRAADGVVVDQTRQAPFYRVQTAVFDAWLRRDCGVIVSLIDKRSGQQRVGYGRRRPSDYVDTARPDLALGVLQVFDEAPHGMSAWQMHEVQREQSLIAGGTSRVLEQGPARIVIATEHQVRGSRIEQRTTFYPDLPRIDYQTRVDWHERGGPDVGVPGLKVAFTAALREAEAWFETPFAAAQRPADGQESVALRWAWVGGAEGGIAVVNDAKYGYDALGDRLRLTLLRSSYSPDHDPDSGSHVIRYALVPTLGHWRNSDLVHVAHGFNQPLIARTARPTTSRAEQRNDASVALALPEDSSVVLAGIKAAESCPDTLVARLYESAGRSSDAALDLPTGWRVSEANVLEEPIRSLAVDGRCLALRLRPWEVRTLLLHRPSVR